MNTEENYTESLIRKSLICAVPLWVNELKKADYTYIKEEQKRISRVIGSKGDIILYKSKKNGETAKAFNDFAKGVAILAMIAEDGIEIFGAKFDYECPEHWKE